MFEILVNTYHFLKFICFRIPKQKVCCYISFPSLMSDRRCREVLFVSQKNSSTSVITVFFFSLFSPIFAENMKMFKTRGQFPMADEI